VNLSPHCSNPTSTLPSLDSGLADKTVPISLRSVKQSLTRPLRQRKVVIVSMHCLPQHLAQFHLSCVGLSKTAKLLFALDTKSTVLFLHAHPHILAIVSFYSILEVIHAQYPFPAPSSILSLLHQARHPSISCNGNLHHRSILLILSLTTRISKLRCILQMGVDL
jgi:hypothetical protein